MLQAICLYQPQPSSSSVSWVPWSCSSCAAHSCASKLRVLSVISNSGDDSMGSDVMGGSGDDGIGSIRASQMMAKAAGGRRQAAATMH